MRGLLKPGARPAWHCLAGLGLFVLALWQPALAATYTFRSDSFAWETAANTISWDRSCTGYPGDDDKATINLTGGFSFSFKGTAYSSVRVLSNGMLQFGTDTGIFRNYANTLLPAGNASARSGCSAGATSNAMMVYWDDLDPSRAGSGGVTWEQKGSAPNRYLVVLWNSVYQYSTTTPYTFQVILYENGEFKYQYGNANATGASATIGVQVDSGDYTLYSYNAGYNANGSAIRWFQASGTPVRLAEYRMDEFSWNGAVGEVVDSTGNGHDGVRVGSAGTTASGYVCRALDVPLNTSNTTTAVDTALDVDASIGASGSISFWYRGNNAWTSMADGQLFDATLVANRSFHLVRRSNGSLRFALSDSSGATLGASTANQSFTAGTWVHLTATWRLAAGSNQSVLRIYVNGSLASTATGSTNGSLDPSLGTLFVGDSRNNITSNNATINSADGRIDELRVYNYELSGAEIGADMTTTHSCAPPLHHLEIRHASGSGVTCAPSSVTLVACQDVACAALYSGGVTGTLTASGGATVLWPSGAAFTIAAGSSSVNWSLQLTTAGSTVLGTSALTPSASSATTCNFGSPACTFSAADSGLVFDVPNHVAESVQTVSVSAVKKADNSLACVPAFASVSKPVTFRCGYTNPATGTLPVRVGGSALNAGNSVAAACDAGGRAVSLAFNAAGVSSTTVQYADVGQLSLSASYAGSGSDAGLVMTGSDSFIAAPASFAFSAITAAPIRAGSAFSASVAARNSAGATTPNFGREAVAESVNLSFTRRAPTGAGANNGSFSGSAGAFSNGSMTSANLVWSEVGSGDLTATLASGSYLGTGLTASGTTGSAGAVGRFIPHHFDIAVTPACGAFSYAGQPFNLTVTAKNGLASPGTTLNYDGSAATTPSHAKAVALSDAPALGVGSLGSGAAVAATAFVAGVASTTPAYSFTQKATAPQTLVLRALDTDAVSSAGFAEGSTLLRSGRLRLTPAFGSEKSSLGLPLRAEYWSGNSWLLNGDDHCTTVPAAAVALSNRRDHHGNATTAWSNTVAAITLAGGQASLVLGAPVPTATGSVELALNLGGTAADQSCLGNHPATTGAARAWLRALNGNCAASADRDPSARASFGIYSPESSKAIHARELY